MFRVIIAASMKLTKKLVFNGILGALAHLTMEFE